MAASDLTGKRLIEWRENRGWTRSYVAKKIGRSYMFIWKMESVTDVIPLDAALLFAALDKGIDPLN